MPVQSFRDLEVWKAGIELVECVYRLTRLFPLDERYGLTVQLRRAAVSIPSNLSEGHQQGTKAYLHFVTLALGSLAEVETQVEIARRLGMTEPAELTAIDIRATALRRMLHALKYALIQRMRHAPLDRS